MLNYMKKFVITLLAVVAVLPLFAQNAASQEASYMERFERLMGKYHYSAAFSLADSVRNEALAQARKSPTAETSRLLLSSTWCMYRASRYYQEDVYDSSMARYRAILPMLEPADKALCYLLLEMPDSALADRTLLRSVPIKGYECFLSRGGASGVVNTDAEPAKVYNLTPTLYELVLRELGAGSDWDGVQPGAGASRGRAVAFQQELVDYYRSLPPTDTNTAILIHEEIALADMKDQRAAGGFYRLSQYEDILRRHRREVGPEAEEGARCAELARVYEKMATWLWEQEMGSKVENGEIVNSEGRRTSIHNSQNSILNYCDTAIAFFPGSEGAYACARLRHDILQQDMSLRALDCYAGEGGSLALLHARNVSKAYFRVIPRVRKNVSDDNKKYLRQRVLESWSQELGDSADHRSHDYYVYIPALPYGEYTLLASYSDDFEKDGFCVYDLCKQEALFHLLGVSDSVRGYLVNYETGAPIAGQKVTLEGARVTTAITDKEGFFAMPYSVAEARFRPELKTVLHGRTIAFKLPYPTYADSVRLVKPVFLDRPIYRPGDTLHATMIQALVKHNREGSLVQGDSLNVRILDPNYNVADSATLVTDAYGQAVYEYVIAPDVLPGRWQLRCQENVTSFTVEAYKQPKFAVALSVRNTLDKEGKPVSPSFGDTIVVEGTAASYAQVPLAGAVVRYSVKRRQGWDWRQRYSDGATLLSDTILVDAEGRFRIAFVAEPDSALVLAEGERRSDLFFVYDIEAEVTDINGETHSQSVSCGAGRQSAYLSMEVPVAYADCSSITFRYQDFNNNPLTGSLHLTVERLQVPKNPYLHPGMFYFNMWTKHTISEVEFHKRYPLYAYDLPARDPMGWPVAKKVYEANVEAAVQTSNSVALPKLSDGYYRIIISDGHVSDTGYMDYMPPATAHVHTSSLLWSDVSTQRAEVGDTVSFRLGSRYQDVDVTYMLSSGSKVIDHRIIHLSNSVETLTIPVSEALLDGITISIAAVKSGISESLTHIVSVPFTHKKLDIQLATFRDKLTPGQQETWTFTIAPQGGAPQRPASLLLTMYDASLDSYHRGSLAYDWSPWTSSFGSSVTFRGLNYSWTYNRDFFIRTPFTLESPQSLFSYWYLKSYSFYGIVASVGGVGYSNSYAKARKAPASRVARLVVEEEEESNEDVLAEVAVTEVTVIQSVDAEPQPAEGSGSMPEDFHLRTNLSTLAFFEPTLRTDAEGRVTFSFTAPDLLTKWNLRGFAWNDLLATGSLAKSLVTQKQLMIQPNMPRFLREGDKAQLLAKVSNQTDSTLQVTVVCELSIPGQPLQASTQQLALRPHAVESVSFPVSATTGGIMATYKMLAYTTHHSDGEQGPLPILTSRQAVTTSVAMYMNAPGTKHYAIPLPLSSTAQPIGFTVEYTANPLWLAVQSLPFLSEKENPSTIYLANSLYVNTLGKVIADRYPELRQAATDATDTSSLLFANADVKNTLLSETPWLRAGQSEAERLRRIASYYDTAALSRQLQEAADKLSAAQLRDGSWPWMPDDRDGSLYTTQHILRTLAPLVKSYELRVKNGTPSHDHSLVAPGGSPCPNRNVPSIRDSLLTLNSALLTLPKALSYVDQKQYECYQRIKSHNKRGGYTFEPDCLDYLYTRSFYDEKLSKKHQESFDFFYSNAKKHIDNYQDLRSQAILALVFQRHGDTKLARTLIERIVEKALYSDEMGMYWRDNRSGWFYYQRPVETQALLIQAFREAGPDIADLFVPRMQQWLLKQKQTTSWNTDIATLHAIQALLPSVKSYELRVKSGTPSRDHSLITSGGSPVRSKAGSSSCSNRNDQTIRDSLLTLNSALLTLYIEPDTLRFPIGKELPICYDSLIASGGSPVRHTYRGDSLQALLGVPEIRVTIKRSVNDETNDGSCPNSQFSILNSQLGWGALYYQYTEQMDKIEASSMGITITQQLFIVAPDGTLRPTDGKDLAVGDKLRLVHNISCDRNMEYIHFKRFRASCLEPVSTASGWTWNRGLSYYVAVSDSHDDLYINRLDKGKYVIEADYYVTNPGTFTLAPSVMQCLYAPEFRATTQGSRVEVK